jgi:hypothetical protein
VPRGCGRSGGVVKPNLLGAAHGDTLERLEVKPNGTMNPDEEWALWKRWLGKEPEDRTIYAEVVEMVAFRKVWRGWALVHNRAPEEARRFGTFSWWVNWNYARSMGMAVRRQVDRDPDVISLARLVDRVWRYPTVLTRDRFLSLRDADDRPRAASWFDKTCGTGPFISPEVPARDWEHLKSETEEVRKWVNTSVAHPGKRERKPPPYGEIHRCVDIIFELLQKYTYLIQGQTLLDDVVMDPWPAIFRTAWIPDGEWEERMAEVERVQREGL